jgi:hypothetical protein
VQKGSGREGEGGEIRQQLHPAAQCQAEQDDRVEQGRENAETGLGDGVVGSLLVRDERDGLGEHRRHRVAMRARSAGPALREPPARRGSPPRRRREHGREGVHEVRIMHGC